MIVESIPNLGPPVFQQTLNDLIMAAGTSMLFELPEIYDPDDYDDYEVTVKLGISTVFIQFEYPFLKFNPSFKDIGTY